MVATPTVVPSKPAVRKTAVKLESITLARDPAGEDRYRMIAEAAYFRAERRGFEPGSEVSDWLAAEIEVDDILGEVDAR